MLAFPIFTGRAHYSLSLRGTKCRGNLLSVGSRVYRNSMSLRASAHYSMAIRTPLVRDRKPPQKTAVFLVLAFPIFTARAHYRHTVRKCPGDTCRHLRIFCFNIEKAPPFWWSFVLALPIFTVRAHYRHGEETVRGTVSAIGQGQYYKYRCRSKRKNLNLNG